MAALPLLMLGGTALYAVPKVNKAFTKDLSEPEDTNNLHNDNLANMEEHGATAGAWNVMLQKQFLMGAPVSDVDGFNYSKAGIGYDPATDEGHLSHIYKQHQALYDFDRSDAQFSLWSMRGEVRPRRSQGIATPLSDELFNPKTGNKTAFLATSYVPNYAHHAQITQGLRNAASDDPERSLRRENGVQFYARAPGQSFRYSE